MAQFIKLIDDIAESVAGLPLHELTGLVVEASGLPQHHGREPGERGLARKENLEELISATRQFGGELVFPLQDADQPAVSELQEFLDQVALDAGDRESKTGPAVQMMTLHSAKGLEFPTVFMTGMEEGLFPHRQSSEVRDGLQEERRLCYVGITRAMRQLYLTHAEVRRLHGSDSYNRPSRFIDELPPQLVSEIRLHGEVERPYGGAPSRSPTSALFESNAGALKVGQRVAHRTFGEGIVLQSEGKGDRTRIQVNFDAAGEKWLMLSAAKLQALD